MNQGLWPRLFWVLVVSMFGVMRAMAAQPGDDFYAGINTLRLNQCQASGLQNGKLTLSAELAEVARWRAAGEPLWQAMSASTVPFTSTEVLVVWGDQRTALSRLASRHCDKLGDAGFTHVGAVFLNDRWWVVLGSALNEEPNPATTVESAILLPPSTGAQLLDKVNTARMQARNCGNEFFGVTSKLPANEALTQAAQTHANDMVSRRYFAHTTPEGASVADRATALGYAYGAIGENIADAPTSDVDQVMTLWLNSPGHCANIMNPQFTQFGGAVAQLAGSSQGKWVLVFGKSR